VTIHHVIQRSPEWFALRAGRLTASEAHIPGTFGRDKKSESTGSRDLRTRLALEQITGQCQSEPFSNADTERGIALEAEALAAYEGRTGHLLDAVGFVSHDELPLGCSPDGALLHGDTFLGGVDVKCPRPANHLTYLGDPSALVADYERQIAHTLLVTGAPWWDLASYCPAFRGMGTSELLIVRLVPAGPVPEGGLSADYVARVQAVDVAAHELIVRQFLRAVADTVTAIRQMTGMEAA
jgi:hypothetical protein